MTDAQVEELRTLLPNCDLEILRMPWFNIGNPEVMQADVLRVQRGSQGVLLQAVPLEPVELPPLEFIVARILAYLGQPID